MLPLTEVASGHDKQHDADDSEHGHAVGEQAAPALQERGAPPGTSDHHDDEHAHGDELDAKIQPAGNRQRHGRKPDDQRRIDLHHVDIQLPPRHPAACDVEQPRDVVLQRRPDGREGDDNQNRQQDQSADQRDGVWKADARLTLGPDVRCVHRSFKRCHAHGEGRNGDVSWFDRHRSPAHRAADCRERPVARPRMHPEIYPNRQAAGADQTETESELTDMVLPTR